MRPKVMALLMGVLILGGMDQGAVAQRRGGFGRGGFDREQMMEMRTKMEAMRACPVDVMWAVLSFDLEMTEDQRTKVSMTMQDAWEMRRDVFALSEEHDAWEEGRKRLRDLRKKTDARVKAALTKDQWKTYEKALKKIEKSMRAR